MGIEIEKFPTLNAPSKVVIQATTQRMRVLDMLDDAGRLTPMGSSKLSFDFSPEWARTLAKAREYGVLEGAVKVAAVLSREDELCTMNTLDRYNHPDGDIMSLLQAIDLVEGILNYCGVTDIRDLPWKGRAVNTRKLQVSSIRPSCRYGRTLHRLARPWVTQVYQWEGSGQGQIGGMALCCCTLCGRNSTCR